METIKSPEIDYIMIAIVLLYILMPILQVWLANLN